MRGKRNPLGPTFEIRLTAPGVSDYCIVHEKVERIVAEGAVSSAVEEPHPKGALR